MMRAQSMMARHFSTYRNTVPAEGLGVLLLDNCNLMRNLPNTKQKDIRKWCLSLHFNQYCAQEILQLLRHQRDLLRITPLIRHQQDLPRIRQKQDLQPRCHFGMHFGTESKNAMEEQTATPQAIYSETQGPNLILCTISMQNSLLGML